MAGLFVWSLLLWGSIIKRSVLTVRKAETMGIANHHSLKLSYNNQRLIDDQKIKIIL
ncbi:hypothetical protein FC50_GL001447 [Lacticaseibacillus pantheris DSM 15945 = JCM 12539 = NBRC 106106]|uniref:Uncharacterized protein n=1 Tax=Lacticaseibacillus pantheris DSM 15945 = JCM 12539 = NBRC 106106 TaxID=1423783 RepID=A0A0R1TY42_9LACO|nr:hypothetical protein FC50_GL001447 [Lacticaseibacillus pantheris DSM 15945 = JCM 12539 = NBRC 106106]